MKGEVEVWGGGKLLLKQSNMITDGAGKLLADIMTVSPSLRTIEDVATSSILDASNYTIQAISFGTGSDAFRSNGHVWNGQKNSIWSASAFPEIGLGQKGNVALLTSNRFDGDITTVDQPSDPGLPSSPNPTRSDLEENTNVNANIAGVDVSSVFPGNGQLVNFFPSAIASSMTEDTVYSGTVNTGKISTILGAFPEGSSVSTYYKNRVIYFEETSSGLSVETEGSYFNEASSMDVSGFVNVVSGLDSREVVTVSSDADFSSNGVVEYAVTLSKSDVLFAHAYGGIYHLGLWAIDMNASLLNGNTPPFPFSVLNNPRKYRLFCRKGTSVDLTKIDNVTLYEDLKIKWRLRFL